MGKKAGQGLSEEMEAMLEFQPRWPCELCRVVVFVRFPIRVEGRIPRHQRLRRIVPERHFSHSRSIECCRRCCHYLEAWKREYAEQKRRERLQQEYERNEQIRKRRVPFLLRLDCIDTEATKVALRQRYRDRVRIEEPSSNVLRVELVVFGWWSWCPVEQGGDQMFFEKVLKAQGLIQSFQKFSFPIDDRSDTGLLVSF